MDNKKRIILILGVNNFVGYYIAIHLSKKFRIIGTYSKDIKTYNNLEKYRLKKLINNKIKLIKYTSPKNNLLEIVEKYKPDIFIFNMFISKNWDTNKYNYKKNKKIIFNKVPDLITCLKVIKCKGFIITGSSEDYKDRKGKILEKFTSMPSNAYGKLINLYSRKVQNLCKKNKLNFVYFRIFSPFGVLDKKNKIIEEFLVSKKELLKINNINVQRNFTYIKDIAKSYEEIINLFLIKNNQSILINLSNDKKYTLNYFLNKILSTFNKKINIVNNKKSLIDKFYYGTPITRNKKKYFTYKFKELDHSLRDIYKDVNSLYLDYYKHK